jgi:antibiotic biosynthesis monooxygenase (ABM) superfamily enzyme
VLRRLADEVGRHPGHLDVTVLRPSPGGRRIYTIVSHFSSRADADAWLYSPARARLVAEVGLHAAGRLRTRYVSGLEGGWLPRRPSAGAARAVEDRAGVGGGDLATTTLLRQRRRWWSASLPGHR